jgi:hypothetical protein
MYKKLWSHLVFTNGELNDVIKKPRIGKCGAFRLTGDNALETALSGAK